MDYSIHRERDHDGAVHQYGYMDISRKSRQQLEEDTVVQRKDSVHFFDKHLDATQLWNGELKQKQRFKEKEYANENICHNDSL